jgi:hypothetical protein
VRRPRGATAAAGQACARGGGRFVVRGSWFEKNGVRRCRHVAGMGVVALLLGAASARAQAQAPAALVEQYRQRCVELMPQMLDKGVHKIIRGPDGWLLLRDELRFAASDRFWGIASLALKPDVPMEKADPIAAIVGFRDDLAKVGIELLFAPAPTREVVMPEAVLGRERIPEGRPVPRLQPVEEEFYAALRARGVNVLDLTKVFLARRWWERGPLYVPSDPHWTSAGLVLAAGEMAAWIKQRPWYASAPKGKFEAAWKPVEHFGPLYQDLYERAGLEKRAPDAVQARSVKAVGADGVPAKIEPRTPESPVILIGDSHTNWWRSQDASLYQQLAYELGFRVDNLATVGGGTNESRANLVRIARSTPGYLDGKKLVIWCFGSRDLLGHKDGWIRTPFDAPAAAPAPARDGVLSGGAPLAGRPVGSAK